MKFIVDTKNCWVGVLGFVVSGLLLTFIQAPFRGGALAWICLVPFILAWMSGVSTKRLMWISYLVSVCYWLCNVYFIGYVTGPGCVAICLYLGLYWPIAGVCIRHYYRRGGGKFRLPLFLVIAMIFVGAEAWQGILITGFNWRLLGQSQWERLGVIQMCDIFGTLGLSFLIAMVNGVIAELIACGDKKLYRWQNAVKVVTVGGVIVAAVFYGQWRIGQEAEFVTDGPLLGSVQSNVPSDDKEQTDKAREILDDLIKLSDATLGAGAKFVCWPETIVLTTINKEYVRLCKPEFNPVVFDALIKAHSKDRGYVMFGGHSADIDMQSYEVAARYNSAFMYGPDGEQNFKRYDKIHLVPFGEYIPFKESIPPLYNLFMKLSPYDYDYNLTKGTEYTSFEILDAGEKYHFGVLICYEDTDPTVTRKMVVDENGQRKADWLVNLSNDGWYVRYNDNGDVFPSTELVQRAVITIFRAVESRVSIIRSVNTGVSCMIDSTGRICDGFEAGTLPEKALDRQGMAGWFVDRVKVDSRVSFFSRYGHWFKTFCAWGVIVLVVMAIVRRKKIKD